MSSFFYDKGKYLSERYDELIKEMKRRQMSPDPLRIFKKNNGHMIYLTPGGLMIMT